MKAIIYLTVNMFMFAEHPGIRMSDYDYDFMAEDEDQDLVYSEDSKQST